MRQIIFYETASHQKPVEEFLDKLSARHAQKAAWVLKLVEELDHVPAQYLKKLVNTDDLWEVRKSGLKPGQIFSGLLAFSMVRNF